jgi:hypothetical protein
MMLADIKSEHGGVFTIEYLIPVVDAPDGVSVSQGGTGIREQGVGPRATRILSLVSAAEL